MSAWDRAEDARDLRWWQKTLVIAAWVVFALAAATVAALLVDEWRNVAN